MSGAPTIAQFGARTEYFFFFEKKCLRLKFADSKNLSYFEQKIRVLDFLVFKFQLLLPFIFP